ncbi:MAG: caleosin family protein [Elusimicrobiota bacterium]
MKLPRLAATLLVLSGALAARAQTLDEAQPLAADLIQSMRAVKLAAVIPTLAQAEMTTLQIHLSFFDKDGSGMVTRAETVLSLRQLGLSSIKANAAALLIHAFLGPKTTGSWRNLDISVKDIKLGKHGSDTGAFDAEGRFVPAAFERMFTEFDANHSSSLSEPEMLAMIAANSKLRPGSETAAKQEFQLLLQIAADTTEAAGAQKVPAISKQRLQEFYDGSLFFKLAKPV